MNQFLVYFLPDGMPLETYLDDSMQLTFDVAFDGSEWSVQGEPSLQMFVDGSPEGGATPALTLTTVVCPDYEGPQPDPYPIVAGTFTASGSGWDVSASFTAPYCTTCNAVIP